MKSFKTFIIENTEPVDHLALHADATTHGLTLPDVEYRKMSSNDGKVFRGELQDGSHVSFTVPDDRYPDFPRNIRYTHPTRGIHREDGPAIISSKPGRLDIPQVKFYYKDGKQIANFTDGKYKDNRGYALSHDKFVEHLAKHGMKE